MLVSEEARVFQVRGLRCSKEPTVLGLSPVRLGNRTYRAWRTTKLTPIVRFLTAPGLTHKPCILQNLSLAPVGRHLNSNKINQQIIRQRCHHVVPHKHPYEVE